MSLDAWRLEEIASGKQMNCYAKFHNNCRYLEELLEVYTRVNGLLYPMHYMNWSNYDIKFLVHLSAL